MLADLGIVRVLLSFLYYRALKECFTYAKEYGKTKGIEVHCYVPTHTGAQHNVSSELMVLAVGAGSVFGSHINESGFWMYKEFFNLSLKQTFLSWTVMETIISFVGLIGVLLLNAIIYKVQVINF